MKSIFILLFIVITSLPLYAQQTISGTLTDSLSQEPVSYATITVIDNKDNKVVNGSLTDDNGNFEITAINEGQYSLTIDCIGYRKKKVHNITVTSSLERNKLAPISISPTDRKLETVTITAGTPTIENKIDKIIYNPGNDITAQGGVAIDVLKKVPQVTVDIDGNVELLGNSNVRFLINGKPSSIFGNSLSDALSSIPGSQIKSIEIITSPGSKYDAQGTAGIINIILKEDKAKGIKGNVNIAVGTLLENGAANLSYHKNRLQLNYFFSGNMRRNARTYNSQDRSSVTTNLTSSHLTQDGYSDFKRYGYQSGISCDYTLKDKDDINLSFGYNANESNNTGITDISQVTTDQNGLVSGTSSYRNATNRNYVNFYDWSASYTKNFRRKEQELVFLYFASYGNPLSSYNQSQTYMAQFIPYTGTQSYNPGTDRETNLSLDYTQPINEQVKMETGLKTVIQALGNNTNVNTFDMGSASYIPDALQSYTMHYKRYVYAGYISFNYSLFHFLNVKTGLRMEHTETTIDIAQASIPAYNSLVPSLLIAHTFNDQTIKLAYSRRIERPDYRDINPFLNRADPYNITTGNPLLKPEIGNMIELGYLATSKWGANMNVTAFARINTNDIKPYTTFYPAYQVGDSIYTNVSVSSRINIGQEDNTGLSLSGSIPISPKLKISGNTIAANRHIVDNINNRIVNSFSVRCAINCNYQLPKELVMEAFCQYRSPFNNIQGRMPQSLVYSFAARKQFYNKKLSVGITTNNPFNKYVRELSTINTATYSSVNFRKVPFRSFGISISYKFGSADFKNKQHEKAESGNSDVIEE